MSTSAGRREQLLAAAATDALHDDEREELETLLRTDPTARTELAALRRDAGRLRAWDGEPGTGWVDVDPSATLAARVARAGGERARPARRARRAGLVVAAALLVAAGSGGTFAVQSWRADGPVEGPPGTLGAVEPLDLQRGDSSRPAAVRAAFVAHTWGTEAVLDVERTRPGAVYAVYVVDQRGREVQAGGFLGSRQEVHCSVNAPVMRGDVAGLRIVDATGATVASARVPRT